MKELENTGTTPGVEMKNDPSAGSTKNSESDDGEFRKQKSNRMDFDNTV
jgi:hypothetical protein